MSRMKLCSAPAAVGGMPGIEWEFQLTLAAKSSMDAKKTSKSAHCSSGKAAKSAVALGGGVGGWASGAVLLMR